MEEFKGQDQPAHLDDDDETDKKLERSNLNEKLSDMTHHEKDKLISSY